MSFSSEVKNELAHGMPEASCCKRAEAAGFVRAAGSILLGGKDGDSGGGGDSGKDGNGNSLDGGKQALRGQDGPVSLVLTTGNPAVARHVKSLLLEWLDVSVSVSVLKTGGRVSSKRYALAVSASDGAMRLLAETGALEHSGGLMISNHIQTDLISTKCCRKSFLRGLFLAAGSVAVPERGYHFEIVLNDTAFASDTRRLMNGFAGMHAGLVQRKEKAVVYLKSAEQIKDMLGIVGAHRHLLAYEDVRMIHEMKGIANRISNCDNANVDRALRAGGGQMKAIARIARGSGGLDMLPQKLREAARARMDNPEASLAEIGAMLDPPIGKSAAAARFARIEKAAGKIR
jgi:DNA-binding protein WhiA